MMGALVSAFWRGDFDHDGGAAVSRLMPARNSPTVETGFVMRSTSGDFSAVDDLGNREWVLPTARFPIVRQDVAEMLSGMAEYWPRPNSWDGSDRELIMIANLPFSRWPAGMIEQHFNEWRLEREFFSRWFATPAAPVSKAKIDEFWPVTRVGPTSGKKPRLWKYFHEHFPEGVPNPSLEPRQTLQGKLLKWDAALSPLDASTLKTAIDEYNASLSRR
jgi:hypothetical protein